MPCPNGFRRPDCSYDGACESTSELLAALRLESSPKFDTGWNTLRAKPSPIDALVSGDVVSDQSKDKQQCFGSSRGRSTPVDLRDGLDRIGFPEGWKLMKRFWAASVLSPLDYYLDESKFRFNPRRSSSRENLSYRLLQQTVQVETIPYKSMIAEAPGPGNKHDYLGTT